MATLTVSQLIAALMTMPPDMPVQAWAPGQRWDLGRPFLNEGKRVLLEGNADAEYEAELRARLAPTEKRPALGLATSSRSSAWDRYKGGRK